MDLRNNTLISERVFNWISVGGAGREWIEKGMYHVGGV